MGQKFALGDTVRLEGEITAIHGNGLVEVWINREVHVDLGTKSLELISPGPAKVGDKVVLSNGSETFYEVLAVHQNMLWLSHAPGCYTVKLRSAVTVVERA